MLLGWSAMCNNKYEMAKCMLKEFQEVNEVPNTSPNARIWSFDETAIFASLAAALLCSLISP